MSEIAIRDVAMRFATRHGEVRALERISVTVPDGQFACIVGPSGCGKSTLLMVAAGLVTPTEGEVLVNGKPTFEPGADRGMVFQSYSLYPWLALFVPAKTPPEIVGRINSEVSKILNSAEVKARLVPQGMDLVTDSPDDLAALIRQEYASWGKVIRDGGIKAE